MTEQKKRDLMNGGIILLAVIFAYTFRLIGKGSFYPTLFSYLRSFIYIGLYAAWGLFIRQRIVQKQAGRFLTSISVPLIVWFSLRTVKYFIFWQPNIIRYLWYLFYLPMLFVPMLALLVAMSLIWIPISVVIGIVLSLIIVAIMKGKLKSVRSQAAANSYLKSGSLAITESNDLFLYHTVTQTRREKENSPGSSTHTSSSGRTHGGGSGKFWSAPTTRGSYGRHTCCVKLQSVDTVKADCILKKSRNHLNSTPFVRQVWYTI